MPADYFFELSMRQAKAGNLVDLITWRKNPERQLEEKICRGFRVHRLNGINLFPRFIQDYPFLPGLQSELAALKPDIIHGESHLFLPTVQALWKAKKLGIPCVVTVHGVLAERGVYLKYAQQAFLRTIGLSVFRSANKVICLTKSDAAEVVKIGCPKNKISVIQNAVDSEFFKPAYNKSDDLIVWVGRFVEEKGVEYIIEVARRLSGSFPNVKFLLIGYGELKGKVIETSRGLGLLNKSVFIRGPLSRREIAEILGKATIFLFPSLKEGMPIALLEAMSCELPAVVFDVTGNRELITHEKNGLVVEPKNIEQLTNAVKILLNDKEFRIRLGQNSRKLAIENYGWDIVLRKLAIAYDDAINSTYRSG